MGLAKASPRNSSQARPRTVGLLRVSYEEGDDLKYEVICSANEVATGVHEVLWSANGWWPDKPASERLRIAEDAVWWALDRGLITLHYDQADDARSLAPHEYPRATARLANLGDP